MRFFRATIPALLCAVLLASCGDEEQESTAPETVSICEVEEEGEGLDEVMLEGEGYPVDADLGFILRDDACSVMVLAPSQEGSRIESGEVLSITGLVRPLSAEEAELAEFIRDKEPDEASAQTVEEIPITAGELVIDLYSVTLEELPQAGE